MNNREEIRWAPFESLFQAKDLIREIEFQKSKIAKPTLSDEEYTIIECKIKECLHTKQKANITYYYEGTIIHKTGIIQRIQKENQKIYFKDHSYLFFEQILKVELF